MKEIYLTRGYVCKVDDEDYPELIKHKWQVDFSCNGGPYAVRTKELPKGFYGERRKIKVYMHREIFKPGEGMTVDHKDGDGLNNQRHNLRQLTRQDNTRYMRHRITGCANASG